MSVTKRALLIDSRIDDLEGTENDVEMMAEVLEKYGFEMKRCIGPNATRDGILVAWQELISISSCGDFLFWTWSGCAV